MALPHTYSFATRPAPLRFALSLACIVLVFVIASSLGNLVDDGSRFLLLGMAVMFGAWFAGTGPALAAVVVGAVLGARDASGAAEPAAEMHLALFVVQGLVLTAVIAELRRALRVAENQADEAKQARRDGEAASRAKDEFLATISHELRTPLNAVLGWVHLLRTAKLDSTTSTRGLDSIDRNVRLQAQLTGDLLDVSKALTGRLQIDSRPASLTDAARQAALAAHPAALAKGVQVETELPDLPVVVLGDEPRLRQIIWHLMSNAIKFTPRSGTIRVVVTASGDQARVTVTDSGPGIDPRFLPRIFDRFTQQDPSPTRNVGGLGVGLSLVRELVSLHGGEIEARNSDKGTGAVFTVALPLQPTESLVRTSPQSAAVPQIVSPPLDGIRVLLLDQDEDARDLLRTILEAHGAIVRTADSVADALESLEGWRPDVLLSDTVSTDRDSYALVGKVRSLESDRGGRIPALALTSFGRTDERGREMLAPVVRDLPKPVEPALLTAEIARLTGRERRHAER